MTLPLQHILYTQGFGTRRVCAGLVQQGWVAVGTPDGKVTDPLQEMDPDGLRFWVQGVAWAYQAQAYLMLHKPAGHECSQKPSAWPSVYTLLPSALRMRPAGAAAGVQAVGRLDQDTTGLLLMSDDGRFIHRLSSPKHHVPKVYEVTCKHPITAQQLDKLKAGVVLEDDPKPVAAHDAVQVSEHHLRLTLLEGKYHQVKRMVAAVSNRVEALHRSQVGPLTLDGLPEGQWRWLTPAEVTALTTKG